MKLVYFLPFLLLFFIPQAEAARVVDDFGIAISQKCLIMNKNNVTSTCPTYEQILELYPDTSPKRQVGDFIIVNGQVQREPMPMRIDNCWNYLKGLEFSGSKRIFVDPPGCMRPYLKMITIESNFKEYPLDKNLSSQMTNNTIQMGNQRYVDFGCTDSIIDSKDWIYLAGDTLNLMNHNCDPKFTTFNHIKKFTFEKSYQNIATSNKYKLDEYFKSAKEKYKISYIGTNEKFENRAVTEDEDR